MSDADDRHADRGRTARHWQWRDNTYRDVWLFALSLLMFVSIVIAYQRNRDRIADIQQSRLEACERQNHRHDVALATTMRLVARPAVPRRKLTPEQQRRSNRAVVEWVNALVPEQNCRAVVQPPSTSPSP